MLLCRRLLQWFSGRDNVSYSGRIHRTHTGVESIPALLSPPSLFPTLPVHPQIITQIMRNHGENYQIFILVDVSDNL
jgi:hypothetical protein